MSFSAALSSMASARKPLQPGHSCVLTRLFGRFASETFIRPNFAFQALERRAADPVPAGTTVPSVLRTRLLLKARMPIDLFLSGLLRWGPSTNNESSRVSVHIVYLPARW